MKKMAKYTQEIKDQAVEAVKQGKSFKEIQQTIGPNPKAVQRYLVKAGIDYIELKKDLIEKGILKPAVNKQKKVRDKEAARKAIPVEEVIEE